MAYSTRTIIKEVDNGFIVESQSLLGPKTEVIRTHKELLFWIATNVRKIGN